MEIAVFKIFILDFFFKLKIDTDASKIAKKSKPDEIDVEAEAKAGKV